MSQRGFNARYFVKPTDAASSGIVLQCKTINVAMNRIMYSFALVAVAVASLAACGAPGATLTPSSSFGSASSAGRNSRPPNPFPIQHVVLMIRERRVVNDLFATFPGAVGTTTGFMRSGSGKKAQSVPVALTKVPLLYKLDLNHVYPAWLQAYRNGNLDGST